MSENKTTYESLDGKIAPEALLKDTRGKLQMVDGHGIKQEADYDDPDKLYGMLIARIQKYHPSADVTQIEKAYNLAKKAHGDQKRKSGEPYIIHPLWVAIILALEFCPFILYNDDGVGIKRPNYDASLHPCIIIY